MLSDALYTVAVLGCALLALLYCLGLMFQAVVRDGERRRNKAISPFDFNPISNLSIACSYTYDYFQFRLWSLSREEKERILEKLQALLAEDDK